MSTPKKSEILEIRISHPDKQALQAKAARQDRTVSDIVRELISEYITQPDDHEASDNIWMKVSRLKNRSKIGLAGLAAICTLPFAVPTFAAADPISVQLQSEYTVPVQENGKEGLRTRSFNSEVHLESGETYNFPVTGGSGDLSISITLVQTGDDIAIQIELFDGDVSVAKPNLSTRMGETVKFLTQAEDGTEVSLTLTPDEID